MKEVNRKQLTGDQPQEGLAEMMNKLFLSLQNINKRSEKLDIVKEDLKGLKERALKKEEKLRRSYN